MIPQAQVAQQPVVLHDIFAALLQARLVLKVQVPLEESAIKLDDLAEGKVLAGRLASVDTDYAGSTQNRV